jgi:hypothetical protein
MTRFVPVFRDTFNKACGMGFHAISWVKKDGISTRLSPNKIDFD